MSDFRGVISNGHLLFHYTPWIPGWSWVRGQVQTYGDAENMSCNLRVWLKTMFRSSQADSRLRPALSLPSKSGASRAGESQTTWKSERCLTGFNWSAFDSKTWLKPRKHQDRRSRTGGCLSDSGFVENTLRCYRCDHWCSPGFESSFRVESCQLNPVKHRSDISKWLARLRRDAPDSRRQAQCWPQPRVGFGLIWTWSQPTLRLQLIFPRLHKFGLDP